MEEDLGKPILEIQDSPPCDGTETERERRMQQLGIYKRENLAGGAIIATVFIAIA